MRRENQKLRWLMALAAAAFGLAFAMQGARSECLSPSAEAGATATTVYRCQEADSSTKQSPVIVSPEKGTEVERGSADIPWFEPKPTKTADPIESVNPIETAKKSLEKPVELSKKPADVEPPKKPVEKVAKPVKAEPAPAAAADAKPVKPKTKKAAKAKRSKVKVAKAKRTKTKVAKVKRSKTPTASASAKTEAPKEVPKAEPAKADEKVIVWTKKDMPIGSRVKNWLGF